MIMFGEELIGRYVLPCILLEVEDDARGMGISDEVVVSRQSKIRLLFNSMDNLGIKRIHPELFKNILPFRYNDNGETEELLANSDNDQIERFEYWLNIMMQVTPDRLEMGAPEEAVLCDKSCKSIAPEFERIYDGKRVSVRIWKEIARYR